MKQDEQKAAVAITALDFVVADTLIGVGTGSTANLFIDALATCPRKPRAAVASSEASRERLQRHGIEVIELNELDESGLEVYIDGADEIDTRLRMIKGGGGALTREKIVAAAAKRFVCIADASKWVSRLGRFPLPVEVLPMARVQIMRVLARLGGRPVWRENFITDNGGQIIDVHDLPIDEPAVLEGEINQLPGVVCNGLFARRAADILLLGTDQGVKIIEPATDD